MSLDCAFEGANALGPFDARYSLGLGTREVVEGISLPRCRILFGRATYEGMAAIGRPRPTILLPP